jgi:type I restriction enzyme S subunit
LQQAFAMFDSKFPDISLGEHTISEYFLPKRGKSLLSKDAIQGNIPVVAGGLEPATYHNISNTESPVITISASGANAGYVRLWSQKVWSSDSSFIDSSVTDCLYFWYILLKKRQQEIFDSQTGSAQPHIYPQHIGALKIKELDSNAVADFSETVAPLFNFIGHNDIENQNLTSLRDTLLPKLMSGELDVSNIEL